jgi:hypothetical protein
MQQEVTLSTMALLGAIERLFVSRVLRRLYARELEGLDRHARTAPPG